MIRWRQRGSRFAALGFALLALAAVGLPFAGGGFSFAAQVGAFALALAPVGLVLHGLLSAASGGSSSPGTRRILAFGAVAAVLGFALSFLLRGPDGWPTLLLAMALLAANVLRLLAAVAVGLALARNVNSVGAALLIAVVATGADLFSVFAGPTRALLEGDAPVVDLLLLVFPVFGESFGFALGLSDFIFLALFAGMSRLLGLRYALTLVCVCAGAFLAIVVGLLLDMPLPALPFISLAFLIANADLIISGVRGELRAWRRERRRVR